MMRIDFDGVRQPIASIEELGVALDRFDLRPRFELWIAIEDGPSLTMLRNGANAWLMYLRHPGDSGFATRGGADREGTGPYTLANGQVDEYPLAWCVDIDDCYKAIGYFFVNDGARYPHVTWHAE